MSPQIGFDEEVAAAAAARVGETSRFSDAMNRNAVALQQATGSNPGPFLAAEWDKTNAWIAERNRAEAALRL